MAHKMESLPVTNSIGIRARIGICTFLLGAALLLIAGTSNDSFASHRLESAAAKPAASDSARRLDTTVCMPRPVFLMHGLQGNSKVNNQIAAWIRSAYGSKTIQMQILEDTMSVISLNQQVERVAKYIRSTVAEDLDSFSSGYDLVCHSQGGLLCRAVIEYMDDHKVHTFISLAGPQMGLYGEAVENRITSTLGNDGLGFLLKFSFWNMVYSPMMQAGLSVANMWHDPTRSDTHEKDNQFLPKYNGLTADFTGNQKRKSNFLRLAKAVFLVGDFGSASLDGPSTMGPWQTGVFGFYKKGSSTEIIPMEQTKEYMEDTFGLQTLKEAGRLILKTPPGVTHAAWVHDYNTVRLHVLPYLGDCSDFPTSSPRGRYATSSMAPSTTSETTTEAVSTMTTSETMTTTMTATRSGTTTTMTTAMTTTMTTTTTTTQAEWLCWFSWMWGQFCWYS